MDTSFTGSGLKNAAFVIVGALLSTIIGGLCATPHVPCQILVIMFVAAILLLLFALGTFDALYRLWYLKTRNGKRSKIGILKDMDWDAKTTENHSFTDVAPKEWEDEIKEQAKQKNLKVKVKLITTEKNFNKYAVIINPYGGVYPEANLVRGTTREKIFAYVAEGGLFVNVADVPGFWAYSKAIERKRHATPPIEGFSKGRIIGQITFKHTPFMVKLGLEVYSTKPLHDKEGVPLDDWNTECEDEFGFLQKGSRKMLVHRVPKIESNVRPVFKTRQAKTDHTPEMEVTPVFIEFYGTGRFLISLVCQSENDPSYSNGQMKGLLADLIVSMLKDRCLGMGSGD